MRTNIVILLVLCLSTTFAAAQTPVPPPPPPLSPPDQSLYMPGRSMQQNTTPVVYKDSVEFAKVFKEVYALVGPKTTVMQDAKEYLARISRSFAMQGIDSAKADSVALIGLDPDAYHKVYFDAYRRALTAVELKKYLEFMKTPEGKKVLSVLPQLQRVGPETNAYLSRVINTNLGPLRQEARLKMEKEHPPMQRTKAPGQPMPPGQLQQQMQVPPPMQGGTQPPTPPTPPTAPTPH